MKRWKEHLNYKRQLAMLLMQYWTIDDVNWDQKLDQLMHWSIYDLESRWMKILQMKTTVKTETAAP